MPRTARNFIGGMCYHVLNRGNGRAKVFHDNNDYIAFLDLMAEANQRVPLRILAYVLMPNHFHLVLWPYEDEDLSRWMQWLQTAHVRRYYRRYEGSGHVWQGRFKAFPIEQEQYLPNVVRYAERNALRANLVTRAEQWPWSSLSCRLHGERPGLLADWPFGCPNDWVSFVNAIQSEAELAALRRCIARGAPYGSEQWCQQTAELLGTESSLRPRGRPKKK